MNSTKWMVKETREQKRERERKYFFCVFIYNLNFIIIIGSTPNYQYHFHHFHHCGKCLLFIVRKIVCLSVLVSIWVIGAHIMTGKICYYVLKIKYSIGYAGWNIQSKRYKVCLRPPTPFPFTLFSISPQKKTYFCFFVCCDNARGCGWYDSCCERTYRIKKRSCRSVWRSPHSYMCTVHTHTHTTSVFCTYLLHCSHAVFRCWRILSVFMSGAKNLLYTNTFI